MNPFDRTLNPSFTFHPQNANGNPNSSYQFFPNSPPPPPPRPVPPKPITPISPELLDSSCTISLIKQFTDLAEKTLKSFSDFLCLEENSINDDLCSCPFDPNHRMPPEFLFRHSLRCPSSPAVLDLDILDSLNYPNSLKSEEELSTENCFFTPLQGSDSDLCFSLDEDGGFSTNFFYRDCPGVVSSTEQDTKRTFTIPGTLSVECVNFICNDGRELRALPKQPLKLLPSDFWELKREVGVWNHYPRSYSYVVLRIAVCVWMVTGSDLLKWVVMNSPSYGIVIDIPIRDHIFVLLKLCLKAVSREAFCSHEFQLSRDQGEGKEFSRTLRFECPYLVESLSWLASQLAVLYGQTNGKLFAINMLKQSFYSAGSCLLLFPVGNQLGSGQIRSTAVAPEAASPSVDISVSDKDSAPLELDVTRDAKLQKNFAHDFSASDANSPCAYSDGSRDLFRGTTLQSDKVFVSQVTSAVAALYERSFLEERIKGLRLARSLSKFHLLNEHAYASKRAEEEREKRPEYKAVIEHDGLLLQRSHNQNLSKTKTKEDILAEERDYKRRRMSYRGKKVKRTPTQVIKDIIEEHMEEITDAGGIGCFVKGAADPGNFPAAPISTNGITADPDELKSSARVSSKTSRSQPSVDRNPVNTSYNFKSTRLGNGFPGVHKGHERPMHHESRDDCRRRSCSNDRQDVEYFSSSTENYRNHDQRLDKYGHHRGHNRDEVGRSKYSRNDTVSSHRAKYPDNRSSTSSKPASELSKGRYDESSESKHRHGSRAYRKSRSGSRTQDSFEDRYDPSASRDGYRETYDDEFYSSTYVRPEKLNGS